MAFTKAQLADATNFKMQGGTGRVSFSVEIAQFRYHVWLALPHLTICEEDQSPHAYPKRPQHTVFKNRAADMGRIHFFKTRYLDASKGEGAAVWELLSSKLAEYAPICLAQMKAQEKAEDEQRVRDAKANRERNAGPVLCALLLDVMPLIEVHGTAKQLQALQKALDAAGETRTVVRRV
jgi:hypothetical protein